MPQNILNITLSPEYVQAQEIQLYLFLVGMRLVKALTFYYSLQQKATKLYGHVLLFSFMQENEEPEGNPLIVLLLLTKRILYTN